MLSKAFGLITFTFIYTVKEIKWQTYARINLKGKVKFWIKYQNMLLYRSRTSSFFERRRTFRTYTGINVHVNVHLHSILVKNVHFNSIQER